MRTAGAGSNPVTDAMGVFGGDINHDFNFIMPEEIQSIKKKNNLKENINSIFNEWPSIESWIKHNDTRQKQKKK